MLSLVSSLHDDEEDALYDIESMFTNIWIDETMNYIIEPPIFLKLSIYIRLLVKLSAKCSF